MEVTHRVNIAEAHTVLFGETLEPSVRRVVRHRLAVPLNKEPVVLYPFVAHFLAHKILFGFQFAENIYDRRSQLS